MNSRQPSKPRAHRTSLPTRPYPAPKPPGTEGPASPTDRSFGWAGATGADGTTAQAWLQTGESYAFTASASIRAVEEALTRSPHGAFSPAAAFGADFALTVEGTARSDTVPAGGRLAKELKNGEQQ